MNLINRRFVPFWYDVAPPDKNAGDGWAYDEKAVQAIGPLRRVRRGHGGSQDREGRVQAEAYPAALIVRPDGVRLGEGLWGIHPPETFVELLKKVMADQPDAFAPSPRERTILSRAKDRPADVRAQLDAARLAWELADFERCIETVERTLGLEDIQPQARAELLYLKGRCLLCQHEPEKARAALGVALRHARSQTDTADGALVALARCHIQEGNDQLALETLVRLVDVERDGRWVGAALYFAGLCYYRLGAEDQAKKLWRRHRSQMPWDRLARRSAASLGLPEAQAFLNQELLDRKGWW